MISTGTFGRLRRLGLRLRGLPRLIALFSYRYDVHLVPDLIANLRPLVDGYAAFDDRQADVAFSDETVRRQKLVQAARSMGGDWVLFIDPDERLERAARNRIPELLTTKEPVVFGFRLREMFEPDAYRVDGYWGEKRVYRMFPLLDGQPFETRPLHGSHHPVGYRRQRTEINLYHLKMISRDRRVARRDLYNRLDPDRTFQAMGYDYLADDAGAILERVPPGREYRPRHKDDGGLWMPAVAARDD